MAMRTNATRAVELGMKAHARRRATRARATMMGEGKRRASERASERARAAPRESERERATFAALALALALEIATPNARAIPQTSECATNSCDGYEYVGRDFSQTGEYFTKGSLKRANFNDANLTGVTLFGADLSNATFVNANLTNANLGQCNLTGANFTNAILSGAIVSSAQLEDAIITNSDWTDVIVRKDVQAMLCKVADGSNPVTGENTALSLLCP